MKVLNAYEAGIQKVIPSVLLYAFHRDKVLMIHRNTNPQDFHLDKWNGLGGKQELGESPQDCAVREFQEESGSITLPENWKWLGTLQFPDFKPHKKEDWFVTVLVTDLDDHQAGQVNLENTEGTLHWIPSDRVMELNLWEGDRIFFPSVLKRNPFTGTFYYRDGKLIRTLFHPVFD